MGSITVMELYDLIAKEENFAIHVWSMDGFKLHALINNVYGIKSVEEKILKAKAERLKVGFGTLGVFVNV